MGCVSSLMTPYTQAELDNELAHLVPLLPVATLMNGGIIKLEGANGFFNPNSLLDPSWLRGRMTPQEFAGAVDYINRCTAYTQVGLSKMITVSEMARRAQIRTQAGMAAVAQINQRHPGIRFTYQQTAENKQINTDWVQDPTVRFAQRNRPHVANASVSVLYISVIE